MGVSVNDTKPDARIAMPITLANSWNTRPTTPPMKKTGMNTATSEMVIDMIVKVISREPFRAASIGSRPASLWRTMFFEHHYGIVDHEPDREREREQRDIVEGISAEIHGGECGTLRRKAA